MILTKRHATRLALTALATACLLGTGVAPSHADNNDAGHRTTKPAAVPGARPPAKSEAVSKTSTFQAQATSSGWMETYWGQSFDGCAS